MTIADEKNNRKSPSELYPLVWSLLAIILYGNIQVAITLLGRCGCGMMKEYEWEWEDDEEARDRDEKKYGVSGCRAREVTCVGNGKNYIPYFSAKPRLHLLLLLAS